MARILLVHSVDPSFVQIDREALQCEWEVENWTGRRRLLDPFGTLLAVLRNDLVFGWFAHWHTFWAITIAWLARRPSVLVIGGFDTACEPEVGYGLQRGGPRQWCSRWVMRRARHLITNSYASRDEIARTVGPEIASRVTVVLHGVPDPFGDDVATKAPERVALSVGVVVADNVERKGHGAFLAAARELPDVEFVLAGSWADDTHELLEREAPPNFHLTGWIESEQLHDLYERAAVYVQASAHEGFGLSVAEAMLAGAIPVVTRAGALPEVVGDTGVVVASRSGEAVAAGVREALQRPADAGAAARARVLREFPLIARAEGIRAVVSRALGADPTRTA